MSKLLNYISLWEKDAAINQYEISNESAKIPLLFQKYMTCLSKERLAWKLFLEEKKQLEIVLEDYLTGKIDGKSIGRPAYPFTETKTSAIKKIDADADMQKLVKKVLEQEEVVLFLKEVIEHIKQRNFQLKVIVDWTKFNSGN